MGAVLVGAVLLIVFLSLGYAFTRTNPATLARSLRLLGAIALGLTALVLALTQRIGPAFLVATVGWSLFTRGRLWPGGWSHPIPSGSRPRKDQSSTVRTPWLELDLDHLTGEMHGKVLKGTYARSRLSALALQELQNLYAEITTDPESTRLLETYLERRFGPGWRVAEEARPTKGSGSMTKAEAYRVLGLESGADEPAIRAAHRRLMLQNHPDKGGSSYLAAKINEAKDVLLKL